MARELWLTLTSGLLKTSVDDQERKGDVTSASGRPAFAPPPMYSATQFQFWKEEGGGQSIRCKTRTARRML